MYCRHDPHPPTVCHSGAEAANLVLTEDNPAVSALARVLLNMPVSFDMHLTRRKEFPSALRKTSSDRRGGSGDG